MREQSDTKTTSPAMTNRLADAIREVRTANADRDDVVVEMREAQRMRLEMLVQELQPVLDAVPAADDWFDFALSSGEQPRFWIDATSHVTMGRDKRTYRFLRDTRLGRTVLAESHDIGPVAEQVTRYIAERMVERERIREGDVIAVGHGASAGSAHYSATRPSNGFAAVFAWLLLGAAAGIAAFAVLFWEKLNIAAWFR